jgi:FkbM family methyltransferase
VVAWHSLLKFWLRHNLHTVRGGWRIAQLLARGQNSVPVTVQGGSPIYIDVTGFDLLEQSLFLAAPEEPDFERAERSLFRKIVQPGDIVFDIGANIGYHAALFASLIKPDGRLIAFEPQPALLPNLRRTIEAIPHARLFECLLSDQPGEATLHVPEHGYHMLAGMSDPGVPSLTVECEVETLDRLHRSGEIPLPDFVKIDVEGAESLVLRGGRELLNRPDAPIIFFEQWNTAAERCHCRPGDAVEILGSLAKPRFELFLVSEEGLRRVDAGIPGKCNLLAVPLSRKPRIADAPIASYARR